MSKPAQILLTTVAVEYGFFLLTDPFATDSPA
jgi:hypothetical protein